MTGDSGLILRDGYHPGVIGEIVSMHARYYASAHGFGCKFESTVAEGLAGFCPRLAHPRNGLWTLWEGDQLRGSIAIDGQDLGGKLGHLRWFIVSDGLRGTGAGRRLLTQALQFCDRVPFSQTHLWTFSGLDAARHLYESQGFELAEQYDGEQWGTRVLEQRFVRAHRRPAKSQTPAK